MNAFNIVHSYTNSTAETPLVDGDLFNGNESWLTEAPSNDYGEVHGITFYDTDRDGVHGVGESGLTGWTVFADLNHNGQLDADEPSMVTARPVSSRHSRTAAAAGDSPGSTFPPGNSHMPANGTPAGRRPIKNRPACSTTAIAIITAM